MMVSHTEGRLTHIGYAVTTSSPSTLDSSDMTLRPLDGSASSVLAAAAELSRTDRQSLLRLVQFVADGQGPAYVVCSKDGTPILAALRLAGGPKTSEGLRNRFGRHIPYVGEREHLLAELWLNPATSSSDHARALAAVAFADPPSNLARTIIVVPLARNGVLGAALDLAQFDPYIHCLSHFVLSRPWRRRVDWIGPPPRPGPSVLSVPEVVRTQSQRAADLSEVAVSTILPTNQLSQEATP
ncbi:MAG: hypothetical protein ACN4GZ_08825 [Acidimicrobiales bacterium]